MVKKILFALYIIIILCLGAATIIEKYHGSIFVGKFIYSSWWMCALWAVLAALAIFYLLKKKIRRISIITLHSSLVIILLGALVTHLTSHSGFVHIRMNEVADTYTYINDEGDSIQSPLPFLVRLNEFEVKKHEGTDAASDFISHITIITTSDSIDTIVSMNNIYSHNNTRLYQTSYDDDCQGSLLSINSDPVGIPITYIGYALLFIGLIWILIDSRGTYRSLLRDPLLKRGVLSISIFISLFTFVCNDSNAAPVLPKETARKLCKINILYNNRICPLQTYALDFTKKLYGKRSFNGYSAEQVFTGFMFWRDKWMKEKIIRIKEVDVREKLNLPKYCSGEMLFSKDRGYILGPYLNEYLKGYNDKFHEGVNKLDEKLCLIMELHNKEPLKIFPYTHNNETTWYGPNDSYPEYIDKAQKEYMQTILKYFDYEAHNNKLSDMDDGINKLIKYQNTYGGSSVPSILQLNAEYIYNDIPFSTILFMINLTMGFLCLFYTIYLLTRKTDNKSSSKKYILGIQLWIMIISFISLTFCLCLRWVIRGTIPLSNGYETMLVMAWIIMLVSILIYKRFHIILTFGFLLSGFFLLVSHISQMDPQITHLMPVLESPLLTIHVSVIMMAYALLALTFICGLMAIILRLIRGKHANHLKEQLKSLQLLSRLFLYPSITALGFGIFIGAIWANISWGTYWSWDPKETWALITLMTYAIAVHTNSIPQLRKPLNYHIFMTFAFLTILMTYFGVNYFLGGMHSYA